MIDMKSSWIEIISADQGLLTVTLVLFFALLTSAVLLILRFFLRRWTRVKSGLHQKMLLVTVPKESGQKKEETTREQTQQQLQEKIAVAETFFSTVGGLKAQRGLTRFVTGRSDAMSFELVIKDNLISFYVVVPARLRTFIEQQIHAQYPSAQIDEVEEYNLFSPTSTALGSYFVMKREFFFPIKTYKKLESDPLNALTNALAKVPAPDAAVVQFVVRSARSGWHRAGAKIVSRVHRGEKPTEAIATHGFWSAVTYKGPQVLLHFLHKLVTSGSSHQDKKGLGLEDDKKHKLSALEEEMVKGIEEKNAKAGLDLNVRIVVSAKNKETARSHLANITNAFSQYNIYEYGNGWQKITPGTGWRQTELISDYIYRYFSEYRRCLVNAEEMASLFHFPLPTTETPNIRWLLSKRAPPPVNMPNEGIALGFNQFRGKETVVRMKLSDRRRHLYVVGMTGSGKSVLLSNLAIQDMQAGHGLCVIDPHGSLVEEVLANVPKERADDVVYFDPADTERPIGLNMLEAETPEQMDFAVQEMIAIFYKLVTDPAMIGPMFEHSMRNAMLTLMADKEYPGTLVDVPRIFTDTEFQKYKVGKLKDPMVRSFWEKEMAKTSDFHKSEMLGYLISKVGRFVENEMMRNIIGQPKSGFNLREIMDQKKILLVNLSKGKIGEINSNLLGLILVSKLQIAALARANIPEGERHDFFLYIDEFQNYITDSIATILAEARKYKLNLILAHQYLGQLSNAGGVEGKQGNSKVRDAVFGNVGTIISFRIGVEDAEFMAKQFAPVFNEFDVVNIEKFTAYVRLLIDTAPVRPFHMQTYPPPEGSQKLAEALRQLSRLKYGRDRALVDGEIMERTKLGEVQKEAQGVGVERSL